MKERAHVVSGTPARAGQGAAESWSLRQASGAGDFVRRHEPRVPKGPERHSAIGPDHQVGDAAVVKGEAKPALWRKLQCPVGGGNMLAQGALPQDGLGSQQS